MYIANLEKMTPAFDYSPKPRGDIQALVYFILNESANLVKIGYSNNPKHRLATLQVGSAHKLRIVLVLKGTPKDEQGLHKQFKQYRQGGEWFTYSDEIKQFIKQQRGKRWATK